MNSTPRHQRRLRAVMLVAVLLAGAASSLFAQEKGAAPWTDVFRQLDEILPSPNVWRSASGAPGAQYWQQRADHEIDVRIDEQARRLEGRETITYRNASPDELRYLWLQLDNNLHRPDALGVRAEPGGPLGSMPFSDLKRLLARRSFDGGVKIATVETADGKPLEHTIVDTMMRVDLPEPLAPGGTFRLDIAWSFAINRTDEVPSRTGAEWFEGDGNWLFELAHWFPRMCAYTDYGGWQNKAFLGRGEFALEFGDYVVRITVPADHVVAASGVLQNPEEVLTAAQRERLEEARTADQPVLVVTPDEARANQGDRSTDEKTWVFVAENVRDFAFATSRKFIWDAWGRDVEGKSVLCMSFWPPEGEPLWSRYSTKTIAHTLEVYSRHAFPYPYPVAISVNGPVGGMEYPMICFNGPRPQADGTYSARTKYALISVIVHEVGHNWFPMIVNSDERQWTWLDEGLNTFVQYLAERAWSNDYPSKRGEPGQIVPYMTSHEQVPVMTNSESIFQFGANAYAKPATALNVLRHTVLGPELFDFSFREYARRWMFKRPQPADFFRSMEDASGVDLDWFWRGWFYSTDHCDVAIRGVRRFELDSGDPDLALARARAEESAHVPTLAGAFHAEGEKLVERDPALLDFYDRVDPAAGLEDERARFAAWYAELSEDERALLDTSACFYLVDLENVGGLVMPVVLDVELESGARETVRIPAEIWRRRSDRVSKLLVLDEPLRSVTLDPHRETADADPDNDVWPPRASVSRFKLFKSEKEKNEMQKAREAEGGR